MEDEIENMNMDWLDRNNWYNFKLTENKFINFHFFYIKDKTIFFKQNECVELITPNFISSEEILTQIKNNQCLNNENYSLVKINYYFFSQTCEDLKPICNYPFSIKWSPLPVIDNLSIPSSLDIFQDLNTINIFYFANKKDYQYKTKKRILLRKKKSKKRI